jgi:hypothetical protein
MEKKQWIFKENSEQEVLGRTNFLLTFDVTQTTQKTTHPTVLLLHVYFLLQ